MEGKQDEMEVKGDSWGRKEKRKEIKIGYGYVLRFVSGNETRGRRCWIK